MDKPTLRQSHFQNYLKCPRAFLLSHEIETVASKAMNKGKIFEFCTFGFKSEAQKKELIFNKDRESTKGKITPGKIKADYSKLLRIASDIRTKYFGDGNAHTRLCVDLGEFILTGEIDWIGEVKINSAIIDGLADLKFCADIPKIWDWKQKKSDFFQSVSYPYIYWKKYGVVKPFYYVIVDESGNARILKIIYDHKKAFAWYEQVLRQAFNDGIYAPDYDECKGHGKFDPSCRFLNDCAFGLDFVFGYQEIEFDSLKDDIVFDQVVNEQHKFDSVKQKKQKTFNPDAFEDQGELKESDLSSLEMAPVKMFTAAADQIRDGLLLCRGCETRQAVLEGDKKCPNCNTPIMWV